MYVILPIKQMNNNHSSEASVNNTTNDECINFDDMDLCMNTYNKGKLDKNRRCLVFSLLLYYLRSFIITKINFDSFYRNA